MKQTEVPLRRTLDGLSHQHQQLLVYAQELHEHFQEELRQRKDLEAMSRQIAQQIRELAAASVSAQEEERQYIAFEVHDRIAQTLASAFHQLQTLESMTQADPKTRQVAVRVSSLVREAIRESRNIMNDLHPPVLDEFGIVPLIQEELRRFQEDTKCQVSFDADSPKRSSPEVEMALYRIFHEALINIRRHAPSARVVTVSLTYTDQAVSLQVQDDGPGFDVEEALKAKRVGGLLSMRRRAEIIGGRFEVTSVPSQGTRATILVPVNGNHQKGGQGSD